MQVTIELPDEVAAHLATRNGGGLSRTLLEMVALEGYRSGGLTEAQLMRMLGLDHRTQVDAFLKHHGVCLPYTSEELAEERETIRTVRSR
jgi:hypothetical protein